MLSWIDSSSSWTSAMSANAMVSHDGGGDGVDVRACVASAVSPGGCSVGLVAVMATPPSLPSHGDLGVALGALRHDAVALEERLGRIEEEAETGRAFVVPVLADLRRGPEE